MYYTVVQVLVKYTPTWSTLPVFGQNVQELRQKLDALGEAVKNRQKDITGITDQKEEFTEASINKGLEIAGILYTCASMKNLIELQSAMDFSRSKLEKSRDTVLIEMLQGIHDKAIDLLEELGDYNITRDELETFQEDITELQNVTVAPRTAIVERKDAGEQISETIHQVDTILSERLDKLMERYREANPDFYRQYHDARMIIDTGHSSPQPQTSPQTSSDAITS